MASLLKLRLQPERRELRNFGLAGALILIVITALKWRGALVWQSGAGGGGALVLILLALGAPSALRPLYVGLSFVTFPIGWVVSHLLLGVLFFGIITPIGLVMRLFGRDRMARKRDAAAASYFTPRDKRKDKSGYFRQY
jgi:hypothetical protein